MTLLFVGAREMTGEWVGGQHSVQMYRTDTLSCVVGTGRRRQPDSICGDCPQPRAQAQVQAWGYELGAKELR